MTEVLVGMGPRGERLQEDVCGVNDDQWASLLPERSSDKEEGGALDVAGVVDTEFSDAETCKQASVGTPGPTAYRAQRQLASLTTAEIPNGDHQLKGEPEPSSADSQNHSGCIAPVALPRTGASTTPSATPRPPQPHRTLLVAKTLTNSDASSGRIILPRVAVETNLPFVTGYRHYALAVRDNTGRRYEFVIKSWANGTEHRRVFVLEQAGEFLRYHRIGVGDTVGICADENGDLVVEANTDNVRQSAVSPRYGALALSAPPPGAGPAGLPVTGAVPGRCARSIHCSKPAGHPGFCSGPKAAAAAAASATAHAHAAAAAAAAASRVRRRAAISQQAFNSKGDSGVQHPPGLTYSSAASLDVAADELSSEETLTQYPNATSLSEGAFVRMDPRLPPGLHTLAAVPIGCCLAKTLTEYDLSSTRVILPAADVEECILNAITVDVLTLAAVDESDGWQFLTLRAWHSIAGRRGYLLDDAGSFLAARGARPGDEIMLRRDSEASPPRVEVRTAPQGRCVRRPEVTDSKIDFCELPLLLLPEGGRFGGLFAHASDVSNGRRAGVPRGTAMGMPCQRTGGCTKPAGHQGFCSGHKGFKRRDGSSGSGTPHAGARHPFRAHRLSVRASAWAGTADGLDSDDDEYTPGAKRHRNMGYGSAGSTPRADDPLVSLLHLLDG